MKNINVGILVNTHGLKGEVKVKVISDFPYIRFAKNAIVYMQHNTQVMELIVQSVREQNDMLLVKFKDYDDINQVEPWKGNMLFVHEDQLQELEEDEAYFFELMNSDVYDLDEQYLGKVSEVIETGANVILRVVNDGEQKLIPFVDAFVKAFDKEQKIMHVEVLEGL